MALDLSSKSIKNSLPKHLSILLILAFFVFLGFQRAMNQDGDDLSASFIGCRLVSTGQVSHLYAHDPNSFSEIGPDIPWQDAADRGEYKAWLHPYVQTPLWAWSLQPLCTRTMQSFAAFQRLFALCSLLSFAACIWLVAFYWARTLYTPLAIALICLAIWFAEPFQYSLALMQTHILFVLLTVLALILAERDHPVLAGSLLAVAATVKLTPGALLLYWLVTRRWKAAGSAAGTFLLLLAVAYVAVGQQVMHEYFATIDRVSHVLLLSQNNQSFAAWVMAGAHPAKEALGFRTFALPGWVRSLSSALLVLCTVLGGFVDRMRSDRQAATAPGTSKHPRAPMGAMIALVAATIFAPISWSHYSIILIAPLMILADEQLEVLRTDAGKPTRAARFRPARLWIAGLVIVVAGLNYQPFAAAAVETIIRPLTLVRSHFYAEVLCLLTLVAVAYLPDRTSTT